MPICLVVFDAPLRNALLCCTSLQWGCCCLFGSWWQLSPAARAGVPCCLPFPYALWFPSVSLLPLFSPLRQFWWLPVPPSVCQLLVSPLRQFWWLPVTPSVYLSGVSWPLPLPFSPSLSAVHAALQLLSTVVGFQRVGWFQLRQPAAQAAVPFQREMGPRCDNQLSRPGSPTNFF